VKKAVPFIVLAVVLIASYYLYFEKKSFIDSDRSSYLAPTTMEEGYINSIDDKEIQKAVFTFLPEEIKDNESGGKTFCSSYLYGIEKNTKKSEVAAYIYAYCEEYYLKEESVIKASGISSPAKITFRVEKNNLTFSSLELPKEGSAFESSIRQIFPESYIKDVLKGVNISDFSPSPKVQAENYYKGRLEVYF